MSDSSILYHTLSVCPVCLGVVEAELISKGSAVLFRKECIEHGVFEAMAWPDTEHFRWMNSFSAPFTRPHSVTSLELGCPRDCGPCVRHLRKPASIEICVTHDCNLRCSVCFTPTGESESEIVFSGLKKTFYQIKEQVGTTLAIRLTGGEPTIRQDLPEIVQMGRKAGFKDLEIATNGIIISRDFDYLLRLKEAGLTGIHLQFDGLSVPVYQQIRGVDLLATKLQAIENCRRAGIPVVLVMTVLDKLNLDQVGDVLRFALENVDVVAELALQPFFASGSFEVGQPKRLSMGDLIFALAEKCPDLLGPYDFYPLGRSHPLCSCSTYLVRQPKGFVPATRTISPEQYRSAFDPENPQRSVFRDILAGHSEAAVEGLSLVIMNLMDIRTMELDRLRQCSKVVAAQDGRVLPFCSYHLMGCNGRRIHPASGMHLEPVTPTL